MTPFRAVGYVLFNNLKMFTFVKGLQVRSNRKVPKKWHYSVWSPSRGSRVFPIFIKVQGVHPLASAPEALCSSASPFFFSPFLSTKNCNLPWSHIFEDEKLKNNFGRRWSTVWVLKSPAEAESSRRVFNPSTTCDSKNQKRDKHTEKS